MKIIFSIIGLFLGGAVDEFNGAFFGFFIGLLTGWLIQLRGRIRDLENNYRQLQSSISSTTTAATPTPVRDDALGETTTVLRETTAAPSAPDSAFTKAANIQKQTPAAAGADDEDITLMPPSPGFGEVTEEVTTAKPRVIYEDPITAFVKKFFTTGNVVVKTGVIILFFGVAFLLKYAAERDMFPIELRLAAAAAFGIAMLVLGWNLRNKKRNYALVIQGGAVGILYLTVFTAAKLYNTLPLGLAFGVMLALVIFSCVLAVMQNSMALAVFATIGGFLAPILTSSDQGNHVALFTYYAFLNAGILGMAWYKSWRALNWLGFVFTFVIASLWGYRSYQPEHFNTTEPFLILFFLFYVAIAILFAHRQPPQLKGLVDGSLVFGTPLVGFALQSQLVEDFAFGESYSALAMGALYIVLAKILWKKQVEGMRLLTESFLALGIIFGSLAIPFALDGRWTAAAWAIEGAGIAWIGIRQQRLLARLFGLLLQIGAAIAFIAEIDHPHADYVILNSGYIGSVLISLSALFIGLQIFRHRDRLHAAERDAHVVLLIWGLIWWFAAGLIEIDYHVDGIYEANVALCFIALSLWIVFLAARRLQWTAANKPPILLLPVMIVFAFVKFVDAPLTNPFLNLGYIAWISAFLIQYVLLYRAESSWNKNLLGHWHAITMWLYLFMGTWIIANAVSEYLPNLQRWNDLLWGVIPAIGIFKLIYLRDKIEWPLRRFPNSYFSEGLFPVAAYLAAWVIVICFDEGNPSPLKYYPIMNPQDVTQLFAMQALWEWLMHWKRNLIPGVGKLNPDHLMVILAGIGFLWLNALVAHCVHFYGGISYDLIPMLRSELFQTSIAIVWTLTAFSLMGYSTRKHVRKLWFAGAVLLAAVVLKLFMIDLADSGTVARIVSFLTVGVLMLIIGYVSPLPPRQTAE